MQKRKKEWRKNRVRLMVKEIKGTNYHNTWDLKKKSVKEKKNCIFFFKSAYHTLGTRYRY